MAGPAGGSGGGHRGGFSTGGGGGYRGGGYYGGYYGRPFGFGGGLLGGILGIILLPAILVILGIALLILNLVSTISIISQGGQVVYDEEAFQDYANAAYYSHFNDEATEEDGLMVIILNYEDNQELGYIAWVGDNLANAVNDAFDSNGTFGNYLERTINIDNYKYSLSKDIAKVMDYMSSVVTNLNVKSVFVEDHDMSSAPGSRLIDKSALSLNEKTVNDSLVRFTEATGIPCAVVVDEAEAVFGKTMPTGNIVAAVITLILIIVGICYIVKKLKRRKTLKNDFGDPSRIRVNSTGRRGYDDF